MMRTAGILLGCLGLLAFGFPCFRGVWNVGNAVGLFLSAFILLLSLRWEVFCLAAARLGSHAAGRFFLGLLGLIAVTGVFLSILTSVCIFGAAVRRPPEQATGVVLGCQVKGTRPSLSLQKRLDRAYEWLNENPGASCVLSGGQGPDEEITEALCMYRYLTTRGVDASRLYMEDRSSSTAENIAFSIEVIRDAGLPEGLAVITDGYHEYRALHLADRMGVTAGAVPTETALWLLPTFHVREQCGILYEWARTVLRR